MPRPTKKPLSNVAKKRRREIQSAQTTYQRQEQRYRELASNLEGQDREIYLKAAEQINQRREALKGIDVRKPSTMTGDQKFYIRDAKNYKASANLDEWQRGETLGRLRLSGTTLGHNFFAATKNLWEGVSYGSRLDAIRRAVGRVKDIRETYGRRPNANQLIEIVSEFFQDKYFDESETITPGSPPDAAFMRGTRGVIANYG